jgi:hypothetical protein
MISAGSGALFPAERFEFSPFCPFVSCARFPFVRPKRL